MCGMVEGMGEEEGSYREGDMQFSKSHGLGLGSGPRPGPVTPWLQFNCNIGQGYLAG